MSSDILVHPVETLVQTKVNRLTLVASFHTVSESGTWERAADDLFEHPLPKVGACRAAEECSKVASQAWHHTGGCGLQESIKNTEWIAPGGAGSHWK